MAIAVWAHLHHETRSKATYATTVHVKLPLVGSKIKNHIASKVPDQIAETHSFTMAWIAKNA